jgi:predicted RNA-binding protein with PIN domain
MDIMSNFQAYKKMHLILVFDAYKVKGNPGSISRYHNIDVVYTKEAETADQYIEKVSHKIGKKNNVRVATSDGLEQLIILGAGAVRISAREFLEEVKAAEEEMRQNFGIKEEH